MKRNKLIRLTSILVLLVLAVLILPLVSCTSLEPFRTELASCTQELGAERDMTSEMARRCETTSFYSIRSTTGKANIAVVEYDDQGYLMNPDLYERTLTRIQELHDQSGALLVLFAHGWKHNASHGDTNLIDFEKSLLAMNELDQSLCQGRYCEGRHTIGVFLGWRGLSTTLEPFKELSFWNRKKHAHRVGQDGAASLIADLGTMQTRHNPGPQDLNRFVIVGHSFGGAIVYSAVQQRLITDLASPNARGTVSRSVANLVILVNPAFEAARFEAIQRRATEAVFPQSHRPVMTIFTSEKDTATKRAFPLGRFFSTMFSKYNPRYSTQSRADRTAIGHFDPYLTHQLESKPMDDKRLLTKLCEWIEFRTGSTQSWTTDSVQLNRLPRMQREGQYSNPYLVVKVTGEIIPDHNEIWRGAFRDFLYSLVAVQDRDERLCRPG